MVICYDVEFPEAVRAAAAGGAELLLVPTALAHGFDDVPQILLRARALESQLAIAYANHSGVEDGCRFLGGSVMAGPGRKTAGRCRGGAGPAVAELDPRTLRGVSGPRCRTWQSVAPTCYRDWGSADRQESTN